MRVLYMITNLINGHAYIGQTKNFEKRMTAHRTCGSKPSPVYYAIQKYGIENFKFEKLAMLEDWMIDEAETKAIEIYNTRKPYGYNLEIGGCKTKQHHPDTIKKISENRKGRVAWNKGKKISEETRKKLSEAHKGQTAWNKGHKLNDEHRAKLSEAHKGHIPANKGKKMSPESCLKMSLAKRGKPAHNRGIPMSEEQKKKLSLASKGRTGRKLSEEEKKRISERLKGHVVTEEMKEKMRPTMFKKGMVPWNKKKGVKNDK